MRKIVLAVALGTFAATTASPASAAVLDGIVCMKDLDDRPVFPAACEAYQKLIGPIQVEGTR